MALLLVGLIACLVSQTAAQAGWQCSSNEGCQLNGVCENGVCKCDAQWLGANCSTLNLGLSRVAYAGMAANTSTWGGHPIYDQTTGLWHGYFAEMTNHCLLNTWKTNSITVHATSQHPWGPFAFKNVVQPAWSHNPLAARDPETDDILVAHIGCGTIAPGHKPQNCGKDATPQLLESIGPTARSSNAVDPPCECSKGVGACQTLQVLHSTSPEGPFVDSTIAWPLRNTSAWPSCLSNPTLLLPDKAGQKTLLAFNGNLAPPNNHGPTSHPGLFVSRSGWKGPYDLVNVSRDAAGHNIHYLEQHGYAEDAVLYRDRRGYAHMLLHGFYDRFPGAHGWSRDPDGASNWEFSATPAYTFNANLDGQMVKLGKRERPQVVIENGVPMHLYNGARRPAGSSQHTFNMVTEICQHGPSQGGVCPTKFYV